MASRTLVEDAMPDSTGDHQQRGSKRPRTEEGTSEEVYVKLGEGLRRMMGQRRFVQESELSRAVLLRYVKEKGAVREVNLIEVKVTMMGGKSFKLPHEKAGKVGQLKKAIEECEGINKYDQQLFLVSKEGEKTTKPSETPLDKDELLDVSCSLALCVDGESSCIISQMSREGSSSLTNIVADAASGPVYAEFKVLSGRSSDGQLTMVVDARAHKTGRKERGHNCYGLGLANGGLLGHGKLNSDAQGYESIKVGDRVGVLAKVGEQGYVRYFLNGEEYGPGFRPGEEIKDGNGNPTGKILGPIKSPLAIAAYMSFVGGSLELLPGAQMPEGCFDVEES